MIKVTLVIFLAFVGANFHTGLSNKKIVPDENIFYDIIMHLQDTIVEVITSLKSKRDFSDQCVTRLLLSMFASLKNISKRTNRIHTDISNASKLNIEFDLLKNTSLFKMDKPIDEIMTQLFIYNETTGINPNDLKLKSDFMDTLDISGEMVTSLRNDLTDIDHLKLLDLENPSQTILELYEKHKKNRLARSRHHNVWVPSNKGVLVTNSRKMLQERTTKIDDFPFVASVHVRNEFVCTGAIIGKNIIVTAASCFQESFNNPSILQNNSDSIFVRVGSDYPDRSGDMIEATKIIIHPKFDLETLRNNIAIIKTKEQFRINAKCKKIRRVKKLMKILPKSVKEITMLGWGSKVSPSLTYSNQSDTLTYTLLNVIHEAKECLTIYAKNYAVKENFCAGFNKSDTGSCQRDIGGPAIIGTKLVGLVSFGPPACGTADAPTDFTNVAFYNKWINKIINNETHKIVPVNVSPSYQPRAQNDSKNLNGFSENIHTVNPLEMKIETSVLRLREHDKQDKQFKLDLHYDDFDFETKPDSHLWITTTVDLLHHPLVNQSLFLVDYHAFIETDPPKQEITTTTSNKPLEEVLVDYYEDKIKEYKDAISIDLLNGTKEYRKYFTSLDEFRKDEVGRSDVLDLKNKILSPTSEKYFIPEVNIPHTRKKAHLEQIHNTLLKPRIWTPQHLRYRILKDFTTHRTMAKQQSNVKALQLRHSSSRKNHHTTRAMNSKSHLHSSVKNFIKKPSHQSVKQFNYENYNNDKFDKYVFLLRHQFSKKSKTGTKTNNHKNILTFKRNVSQIPNNVKYYKGLKSNTKYKANLLAPPHRVSDDEDKNDLSEEELNQNMSDMLVEEIMHDQTTQATDKHQNRFNKVLHNKTPRNGIIKISKKLDKPSLDNKTHLRVGDNNKVQSSKNNELQKVLVLIMDREISVIDERTHKYKTGNPQLKSANKRIDKSTTKFKITVAKKSNILNIDNTSSSWEKLAFKKQKRAQKTTKSDKEFHVEQILRKLNISTTPKINSITKLDDKASDFSSEYNFNLPQMFKSLLSGTENDVSKSDKVSYQKIKQISNINNVKLHTASAGSKDTNIYSADSNEISTIVENKSEYDENISNNSQSDSKPTVPNFLEYIDF